MIKQIFSCVAFSALLLFSSTNLMASWMVEPYVGYSSGNLKSSGASDITISGTEMGLRLGYQLTIPWFAVDYTASTQKASYTPSLDANKSAIGLTVGLDFPLIRLYAGYGIDSRLAIKDSVSSVYKGTSTKAAVGIKILMVLDLNIEYCMNTYGKLTTTSVTDQSLANTTNNSTGVFLSYKF
jgi:hypothetical protein